MEIKKVGLVVLLVGLLAIGFSSVSLAQERGELSEEVEGNVITAIQIEGNEKISEETIKSQLDIEIGDKVTHEKLKNDMEAVFELGYFFDVQIDFKYHDGGVMLVFEAIENPVLEEVVIEGNREVSDNKLRELLSLKTGEILNMVQLEEGQQEVMEYYEQEGYILAGIEDVRIEDQNKLHFRINEGQFQEIKLEGNKRTKDFVVKDRISAEPGDSFNIEQIEQDLQRVHKLGYFEEIKPQFYRSEKDPQAAIVELNLEEGRFNNFEVGGGYSLDGGLTGSASVEFDNLRGGGENAYLNLDFGDSKEIYQAGYSFPWPTDRELNFGVDLYYRDQDRYGEKETRRGSDVSLERALTDNIWGGTDLTLSQVRKKGVWQPDHGLTLRTVRDTRDHFIDPRSGSRTSLSLEQSGLFGSKEEFTKYQLDFRQFFPVRTGDSLALRIKTGDSFGRLNRSGDQFSLGGMDGIRGYGSEYFSADGPEGAEDYSPKAEGFRGDSMLLGSLEYRRDIIEQISGVAFFDVGRTFEDKINARDFRDLHYSTGVGIRVDTPVGRLGADYGYAPSADYDNTEFSIQLGQSF